MKLLLALCLGFSFSVYAASTVGESSLDGQTGQVECKKCEALRNAARNAEVMDESLADEDESGTGGYKTK